MGELFPLLSQLRNLTNRRIGFKVSPDGHCPVPDLKPKKTRHVKLSRILKCLREPRPPDWKIRVFVDDQFTGIELNPLILLDCTRILFGFGDGSDSDVLFVEGVPENFSDYWLRLKYFGFMRNMFWDSRESFPIERSNSRLATKLRGIEARGQDFSSIFIDTTLLKSSSIHTQSSSPIRKAHNREVKLRKRHSPVRHKINNIDDEVVKIQLKVPAVAKEKPRIPPVPPPSARRPPPPSPPPGARSREQYYSAAEGSSDEDSGKDTVGDSSSDTTNRVSPTLAGSGIGRPREEKAAPDRMEIGGSDGSAQRSIRREQMTASHHDPVPYNMDSFEHVFLFCLALALVWVMPKLFF